MVAILGYGVVGSGVYEILKNIQQQVKYILDIRDLNGDVFIKDFNIIENDLDITTVAEVIGGVGAAYEFTKRALKKGKNVVTSNKELVATHGAQLLELAKENNVRYFFEASVGGGIPIIRPMVHCLAANKITEITGILNGTCNYILTQMEKTGADYADAIRDAQQKGYAEQNPSADVDGHDTCRKISILASLASGKWANPENIKTVGISAITADNLTEAADRGYSIKLLGRAMISDDVTISVEPYLIPKTHMLYNVSDVYNAVLLNGNFTDDVLFYGRGAGKLPTASAVVADIIDTQYKLEKPILWTSEELKLKPFEHKTKFVFRDGTGLPVLK